MRSAIRLQSQERGDFILEPESVPTAASPLTRRKAAGTPGTMNYCSGAEAAEESVAASKPEAPAPAPPASEGNGGKGKRGTGESTKGKRKKAKLESFRAMPLDILHDILAQLDLPSLLAISRTNKQLRAFVLEASCQDVWEGAMQAFGLPRLTSPGCDYLRYTNLLFGKGCDFCSVEEPKTKRFRTDMLFRVRLCADCWKQNTTNRIDWTYFEYVLKGTFDLQTRQYEYFLPDVCKTTATLAQFDKEERLLEKAREDARMHLEDEDYEDEELGYVELPAKTAFTHARREILDQRMADDLAIRKWRERQKQEEKDRKEAMRKARRADVESRFRAEGWTDAHFVLANWQRHPLVAQARPLTEKVWPATHAILVDILRANASNHDLVSPVSAGSVDPARMNR